MDAIVEAALRKWPQVPACHAWLALDARGDWYMRDERVQAKGLFPAVKGSRIEHEKLKGFIARNYACDDSGAWYFQNGPQRVYVDLECTPWVWRLTPSPSAGDGQPSASLTISSHTGQTACLLSAWLDEHGRLYLFTDLGLGVVHTQDMHVAAEALEQGSLPEPQCAQAADLPTRFHFVRQPRRDQTQDGG